MERTGLMYRLIWSIPLWISFQVFIFIPFCLIGYILVPIALLLKAYRVEKNNLPSRNNGHDIYHFTWPIMFLFNNFEDGFHNTTYFDYGFFWTSMMWTCVRNPVNNLRIVPYLSVKIQPQNVDFIGTFGGPHEKYDYSLDEKKLRVKQYDTNVPHWYFCWHGIYSNFYRVFKLGNSLYRFWIGWKIMPYDIFGVSTYRVPGAGFALQFKRVKKL